MNQQGTTDEESEIKKDVLPKPLFKDISLEDTSPEDSLFKDLHEEDKSTETPKQSQNKLQDRTKMQPPRRLIESMLAKIDEPESFSQAVKSSNKQH